MANLEFLRIALKAGKLEIGNTRVRRKIKRGKLLVFASDFSRREMEKFIRMAERLHIPYLVLDITKEELGRILSRRPVGVLLITDENMVRGFTGGDRFR